jgi:MFS family permease
MRGAGASSLNSRSVTPGPERLLTPRFVLVVVVGLAYFLSVGMLLPTLPLFVTDRLGGGNVSVGIVVGAFAAGAVLLRPLAGRFGDRAGRRLLIIGGALLVGVAVSAYHLTTALPLLVGARVLGGAGEAAFFVGAGTMITDLAPEDRRGEAISYWSVAVYGGLAFGPSIGQLVLGTDRFGAVWTATAAFAFAAAFGALFIRETLVPAGEADHDRPPAPLVHRAALAPGVVLFLGMLGLAGFTEFLPLYVKEIGMADSKVVFFVYGGFVLLVRLIGARIPDTVGPLRAAVGATVGVAAGMGVIALFPHPAGLYAGTIVLAMGMSLLYPAILTLALTGVPEHERGSAVGTISSFFDLSAGLGSIVLGGVAAVAGYRGSFAVAGVCALGGLALLLGGIDPRTRKPTDHDAARAAAQHFEPETA